MKGREENGRREEEEKVNRYIQIGKKEKRERRDGKKVKGKGKEGEERRKGKKNEIDTKWKE